MQGRGEEARDGSARVRAHVTAACWTKFDINTTAQRSVRVRENLCVALNVIHVAVLGKFSTLVMALKFGVLGRIYGKNKRLSVISLGKEI